MSKPIEFEGVIEAARGGGACIPVPFDPGEVFGTRRSVRVIATYDGFEAKSSVMSMGGRPVLGIHKATREAIEKDPGDAVTVTVVQDTAPRTVNVPAELKRALKSAPDLKKRFDTLSFTHRREYAEWVAEGKRQETRDRRAAKALDMLAAGQTR